MMQIGKKIANENLKNVAGGMDSCTDSGFIFSDPNLDDRSSDYEENHEWHIDSQNRIF